MGIYLAPTSIQPSNQQATRPFHGKDTKSKTIRQNSLPKDEFSALKYTPRIRSRYENPSSIDDLTSQRYNLLFMLKKNNVGVPLPKKKSHNLRPMCEAIQQNTIYHSFWIQPRRLHFSRVLNFKNSSIFFHLLLASNF